MTEDEKYYREPWMNDDQWECALLLAELNGGFHHCYKIKPDGLGIETNEHFAGWATFDFNKMTRVVLMAHARRIRVGLVASGTGLVKIRLGKRQETGQMHERHPGLEDLIAMATKMMEGGE